MKVLAKFLVVLSMILPCILHGQGLISISGRVTDKFTGNPLPYAQLSVQNSTFGTVSNEEGRFELNVPSSLGKDTLLVAYLGYETMKFNLMDYTGAPIILNLVPRPLQLSEVEIVSLTPEEVIRQSVAHIPVNYGEDSLILTAFVRSQKFVNGKLAEYAEAIIMDLKTGYSLYSAKGEKERRLRSNVPLLLKGRVISDTNRVNATGDLGKAAGCLGCNFINDFAEFYHHTVLDENIFRKYTFKMEEILQQEGEKIYHIWFDQKKGVKETLWKGELFVNAADFAILKISQRPSFEAFDEYEKQKYHRSFTIKNLPGWFEEMPLMDWTTTYSVRDGKYYLSTIRIGNWMTFIHPSTGLRLKFAYKNEVVVTDVTRDPIKIRGFKGDKSVGVNQRWDQLVGESDDLFWAQFNYLPIEKKLGNEIRQINK